MKANAPEKLYVDAHDNLSDFILYGFTEKRTDDDIEYMRTDAFIEKACNYLFSHISLFVTFFDDDIVEDIERSEFIKKFRITMEDKL